jgi:chromosome segregation ATPase
MRPVEYQADDIVKAGLELQAAGRNITGFALRQKLGGGTASRLKQVWDEHQNGLNATASEPLTELPIEVADHVKRIQDDLNTSLLRMATELNDRAVKTSERRVAEIVREASAQRKSTERELADAAQTVEDLETNLADVNKERQRLVDEVRELTSLSQMLKIELAQLRERQIAMETALSSCEAQRDEAQRKAEEARDGMSNLRGQVDALEKLLGGAKGAGHQGS